MAASNSTLRPLSCWKSLLRHKRQQKCLIRTYMTHRTTAPSGMFIPPAPILPYKPHVMKKIITYPPPPSPAQKHKEPIKELHAAQIAVLDPTGARTKLFSKSNSEAAHLGDILLVRLKTGDPFAGVCINIRRRGVDTAILLRNQLTRVGVEMWYKIYSPNVEGIEVVKRAERRARRARLTFMRKPKHDIGSVQNAVVAYQKSHYVTSGVVQKKDGGKRKVKVRAKGKKN